MAMPAPNSRSRGHRRDASGATSDPRTIPTPHAPPTSPRAWTGCPRARRTNRGSIGDLIPEATIRNPSTRKIPRTKGVANMYRIPSTMALTGPGADPSSTAGAGNLRPWSRHAETAKDPALIAKAGPTPRCDTRRAPRIGPPITARWNVEVTSALAATSRSSGTTLGSDAWALGRNRAPNSPRTKATAYR